MIILTY